MSTSSTPPDNLLPAWASWSHLAPYMGPPIAAAGSVIPVYYGFEVKSAQQLGLPVPKMSLWDIVKGGFKAAPTIGTIVGTQMVAQNLVEKNLFGKNKDGAPPELSMMLISSTIVAAVSAPLLAAFNGQTMGRTVWNSLRELSVKQTGAILGQETIFLFSARVSGPLNDKLKEHLGDTTAVRYSSPFLTGMIGAFFNHPANTALTLWQKNKEVVSLKQLMRGSPARAITVGAFMACYQVANDILKPKV